MKELIQNLRSLARTRNLARDALQKVLSENEIGYRVARKTLKNHEGRFIKVWEKYSERYYQNQEFFSCCEQLKKSIIKEQKLDSEFRKIYKPFYDKVQKLSKEYNRLKSLQSKKRGKRK